MPAHALFVTGPVGVGKTTVGFEIHDILGERKVPHVYFDVDAFTYFEPKPPDDRHGHRFSLDAVSMLYGAHRERGIERIVLARVLMSRDSLAEYAEALDGADIFVARLTAPLPVIEQRLQAREVTGWLDWHVDRAAELDAHWRKSPVEDVLIETHGRSVREIALEALVAAGW
jgi:adenylylsulfate kinase